MQGCAKLRIRSAALLGALVVAGLPAAGADEPDPPSVPLDRLLKLPSSAPVQARVEKRGGSTRSQWQTRFAKAREERESARLALEEVRAELRALDPVAWLRFTSVYLKFRTIEEFRDALNEIEADHGGGDHAVCQLGESDRLHAHVLWSSCTRHSGRMK